jgi:hypothetical protein
LVGEKTKEEQLILRKINIHNAYKVLIEITLWSGGFGLQGGALFKNTLGSFSAKCPDCYKVTPKTVE